MVNLVLLLLIGAVSLNVMPLFPPRPRNAWVGGSSVELRKALLLIRKQLCAITPRYFIRPRSWGFAGPIRVSVRSRSTERVRRRRRFSLVSRNRFSVAEDARDTILGHQIGTACRGAPVQRS